MATYAMTINERTNQGKALLAYLNTLNISMYPLTGTPSHKKKEPCRFSKDEMRAILADSVLEARSGFGITHDELKGEIETWLR